MVNFYESFGYLSVFGVLMLCGFGLPLPEDVSILAGGIISGLGYTNVHLMCFISLIGVMLGDMMVFYLGRRLGDHIFKKKLLGKILSHSTFEKITVSLQKNGWIVLFIARFLPGLRSAIFLTAGITRFVKFPKFFIIDFTAALISVPLWTYLGYYGASNLSLLTHWIKDTKIITLIILGIILIIYIAFKLFKRRLVKSQIIIDDDVVEEGVVD
jgi:membrane protein DedA with SNARE-associated domain